MNVFPQMIQGSEEWFRARKGRVTASNADRILTPSGKDSSQWDAYAIELVAECIRPDEAPSFIGNAHTDRGNDLESEAREHFESVMQLQVMQVGFITRGDGIVGCSPDGLIYQDGEPIAGVEIKCPLAKHHLSYLVEGGIPRAYLPQVHFSMAVTGLPWYFISYCPGMAPHIALARPDDYTAKMADAIDRFLIFYSARRKQLLKLAGREVAA